MKWPLALLALATAAPGLACLPPIGNEPSRTERVLQAAAGAPDIVYAVVERAMLAPRRLSGELRRLRILQVYKGGMRPGQRLVMHISAATSMCEPRPPASMIATRGARGVLLIYPRGGNDPIPFPEFLWPSDELDLARAGIIPSGGR